MDYKFKTEEIIMSQAIKNVLNSFAFDKVNELMKTGFVTPQILDQWVAELLPIMRSKDQKIGHNGIREILVQYILDEFDVAAFGVESKAWHPGEITDKTIRRMKNQRKKKFVDLKIVKAAK
ncbi:receptor-recognition protein assembly protein [Escherichia phage vB_EcoM_ESCO10]|nr:receptor-recognition protein assembly protein [Escherichia phage vB_EcoM_ESCO10]